MAFCKRASPSFLLKFIDSVRCAITTSFPALIFISRAPLPGWVAGRIGIDW